MGFTTLQAATLASPCADALRLRASRKLLATATENVAGTATGPNAAVSVAANAAVNADGTASNMGTATGTGTNFNLANTGQTTDNKGDSVTQSNTMQVGRKWVHDFVVFVV
jgi:hypothetical protein